jgi:hypothetical protein
MTMRTQHEGESMKRWLSSAGVGFAALLLTVPCQADIYTVKDAVGIRHFTDKCPYRRCQLFLKTGVHNKLLEKPANRYSKTGSRPDNFSYYTYYSRALMGYPTLRTYSRQEELTVSYKPEAPAGYPSLRAYSSGANSVSSQPRVINQANRQLYTPQIELVARTYGLDPKLIHAVISAESAYNPAVISDKGAMGLMQLMPDTARRFGVPDPFDPIANLHGGARYLRWLMDHFQNNLNLVLAAYNAGEGAVEHYGNTIPPFEETRTYVVRVLDFYNYYRGVN